MNNYLRYYLQGFRPTTPWARKAHPTAAFYGLVMYKNGAYTTIQVTVFL